MGAPFPAYHTPIPRVWQRHCIGNGKRDCGSHIVASRQPADEQCLMRFAATGAEFEKSQPPDWKNGKSPENGNGILTFSLLYRRTFRIAVLHPAAPCTQVVHTLSTGCPHLINKLSTLYSKVIHTLPTGCPHPLRRRMQMSLPTRLQLSTIQYKVIHRIYRFVNTLYTGFPQGCPHPSGQFSTLHAAVFHRHRKSYPHFYTSYPHP